ncbi:MAG: hypothetical protein M3P16_01825 [Chloroflexota bacterium]|nr:hypothetical protein [Chloroflexota bacterium]
MIGDAFKLVKFVCVAKAHADGRSDSALTIHEGSWAFCPEGGDATGHDWRASDGLPMADALRLGPRQPIGGVTVSAPTQTVKPTMSTVGKGKART